MRLQCYQLFKMCTTRSQTPAAGSQMPYPMCIPLTGPKLQSILPAKSQAPRARSQIGTLRCQVPGTKSWVPDDRLMIPSPKCQVLGSKYQLSSSRHELSSHNPGPWSQVLGFRCRTESQFQLPIPGPNPRSQIQGPSG